VSTTSKGTRAAKIVAFLSLMPLLFGQTCTPGSGDHPLAMSEGAIDFAETQSTTFPRSQQVSSGAAAPILPFELSVTVTSDQPMTTDDVEISVTFLCAFGNTSTFDVDLSEVGVSGQELEGAFSRAANVGTGECVASSGQREQVTWTVQFTRPSGVTQQMSFDYVLTWRQASVGN